jgi:hypothetical protein
VALGLGLVIGAEREFRGREAGLRTSALVCVGAALFGETSALFEDSRVAAGVVQGIGFLGAGLIFRAGNEVQNATTAVTMWVLAGIGLAVVGGPPDRSGRGHAGGCSRARERAAVRSHPAGWTEAGRPRRPTVLGRVAPGPGCHSSPRRTEPGTGRTEPGTDRSRLFVSPSSRRATALVGA